MKPSYQEMKALITKSMSKPENRKGKFTNWNFVDAEVFAEVGDRFETPKAYQRRFEKSVDMVLDEMFNKKFFS